MWIDTHCHLDDCSFDKDRDTVLAQAQSYKVCTIVIPGVFPKQWRALVPYAKSQQLYYALGLHPMYVNNYSLNILATLEELIDQVRLDPLFIGVGEIGLDGFVKNIDWQRQEQFFSAQLKIALKFDLPVIMHVRHAQDQVLKYLRRFPLKTGIAHAFNGSQQQAEIFISHNIKLGVGGAATFSRALNIQRLLRDLPKQSWVLETDSPDIAPEWINKQRNEPRQAALIAEFLADFWQMDQPCLSTLLYKNSCTALQKSF